MAGCTVKDAMAAYRAFKRQQRTDGPHQPSSANVAVTDSATSTSITSPSPFVINGVHYAWVLVPSSTPIASATDTAEALSTLSSEDVLPIDSKFNFHCSITESEKFHVSINWDQHSDMGTINDGLASSVALTATQVPIKTSFDSPFFVDTGANTHLTPVLSDFKTLRPILPHPISGVGSSCIHAVGIGTIEIPILSTHKFTLHNALYAPTSKVRLISVLTLNRSSRGNVSHFSEDSFWVTNASGETILHGSINQARRLYCLDPYRAHVTQRAVRNNTSITNTSTSALYTSCTPDVETWHCCLVVDMAHKQTVEGMTINLSSSPPKCQACILGKQMRSSVPKIREGERASRPLEQVFVDLCGPICPTSSSGRLYSMNVINDFSSYIWSLPLRSKGDVASILQMWHRAVTNQTDHKLQTLVTDNSKLVSNAMSDWCTRHGIDHRRTTPYTSAQNRWAECLHRTLLEKACAILVSCKAPPEFWDEFCTTSAYLTNLTAMMSLQNRTPFELWFGRKPSLSHLRKIGCRAFTLIPMAVLKSSARSCPCVLIGYSPHSKAY